MKQIIVGINNYIKQKVDSQSLTDIQLERYNICKGCEFALSSKFFTVIPDVELQGITGKKCRRCGCSLSLKIRSNSKCPEGKW